MESAKCVTLQKTPKPWHFEAKRWDAFLYESKG
ncbi:hypothetical protein ACEQUB_02541 [Ralstonia syzygii]|uniref:Uncharacterized protein n=1 Tax=Ralstonia syzygii R24 TaxID=907261 RepID=G3A0T9_9RALS|nr:hypothetical protein RALSY_10786 [Ralstonia syzygii R24]